MTNGGTGSESSAAFTGLLNVRDIGGLPLHGGGTVRHGELVRSDALASLSPAGVVALESSGIGTVFDLRTESERLRAPEPLPTDGPVKVVELPILGGSMEAQAQALMPASGIAPTLTPDAVAALLAQVPTLAQLYVDILGGAADRFAEIARTIARPPDAARPASLVHCTAGKDRTGLAVALVLSAIGTERSAIVADYALTEANLAGAFSESMMAMFASLGLPDAPQLRELATQSPPSAIEAALDWIAAEHGDAAAYLRSGGLTDDELADLRTRMRDAG